VNIWSRRKLLPPTLLSLGVALAFDWLPWQGLWQAARPDLVALVLLYWCIYTPHRVGIAAAWLIGLLADVADASLFGQHALSYALMAYAAIWLHRRIQMLNLLQQTAQIFPLLLLSDAVYALISWQAHDSMVWSYLFGCMLSALLWVPTTMLLQRLRSPRADTDPE